jgi:hypothetical protein
MNFGISLGGTNALKLILFRVRRFCIGGLGGCMTMTVNQHMDLPHACHQDNRLIAALSEKMKFAI